MMNPHAAQCAYQGDEDCQPEKGLEGFVQCLVCQLNKDRAQARLRHAELERERMHAQEKFNIWKLKEMQEGRHGHV